MDHPFNLATFMKDGKETSIVLPLHKVPFEKNRKRIRMAICDGVPQVFGLAISNLVPLCTHRVSKTLKLELFSQKYSDLKELPDAWGNGYMKANADISMPRCFRRLQISHQNFHLHLAEAVWRSLPLVDDGYERELARDLKRIMEWMRGPNKKNEDIKPRHGMLLFRGEHLIRDSTRVSGWRRNLRYVYG
jgi:hypothetical protein